MGVAVDPQAAGPKRTFASVTPIMDGSLHIVATGSDGTSWIGQYDEMDLKAPPGDVKASQCWYRLPDLPQT